jgi:hypothetical protein
VTPVSGVHGLLLVAVAAGVLLLWRADRMLGRVLVCCVLVPETLVALIGLHEPALLDRTLTSASWGPCLALGALVAAAARHSRAIAAVAVGALALVVIPPAVDAVAAPSSLDRAVRHVEQVARSGDVVASHPGGRLHLLLWSVAVRHRLPFRMLPLAGPGNSTGAVVGRGTASRRTWLLVSTRLPFATSRLRRCAPDWTVGRLRVLCLLDEAATAHFREAHPSTPTAAVRF